MNPNLTIARKLTDTHPRQLLKVDLYTALNRIKTGNSGRTKELIQKVRGGRKEFKKDLPVVMFSGTFSSRKDEGLQKHSNLIALDFDHVNVQEVKTKLVQDQYILAVWRSPSGDGVKALLKIEKCERHRDHFRSAQQYFEEYYDLELDSTGINESRLCFESYDPDIFIKEWGDVKSFTGLKGESSEPEKVEVGTTDYSKVNIAVMMIHRAMSGEKHNTLIRASMLMGGYIASGKVEEHVVKEILFREISKRDIESEENARKAIDDGIEKGKTMPIMDVMGEEKKILREMRIKDGDMSFISNDDADYEWIDKYVSGDIELGLTTGNEGLDKYFMFKREFVMVNGHSNIGKTTFMLYMMVAASMHHGWRWVLYSSENKTAAIKMKLMQFAMNMPIRRMNYEERKASWKWVQEHFEVISNKEIYSYTDILIFCEKVHSVRPIDGVLIDPYNSLKIDLNASRGVGVHEYHYEAASEFLTFCNRVGIALWVNAHSVTESQRRKGSDGLQEAPYAEDTEHGGKWVNRCDCFITLHRKVQHMDPSMRRTMEMHVRKVREVETGGQPTPFSSPLMFELNSFFTGFGLAGPNPRLFAPLSEKLKGEQLYFMED